MKALSTLLPFLGLVAVASAEPASPNPSPVKPLVGGSDSCTTPDLLVGVGPHSFDQTLATTGIEGQAYNACRIFGSYVVTNDVWFEWTATSSGWVMLNFCNLSSSDLKVAVYSGLGCPTAEPVVCDDDGCGTLGSRARAPFLATSGTTYTFQVGTYNGTTGATGAFTIDPFTPGPGDSCSAPIPLVSGPGPYVYDNSMTTTGLEGQTNVICTTAGDPNPGITYDSWYTYVAPCTGTFTLTLCGGSTNDTKMAIYDGAGCPAAAAIACNDDMCAAGGPSEITINVTAGNTYTVQMGMWPGWLPGVGTYIVISPCPPSVGTPYCFGDGTGAACPCGNTGAAGNGCASSINVNGANLTASGVASLAADTVTLLGSGMPNSSCLYFQGTTQIAASFGDGLRCTAGVIVRLKTKTNVSGASQYPEAGDPSVSVRGMVTAPGTRNYQAWYRNAAAFCTPSTFNLSNAVSIMWQ